MWEEGKVRIIDIANELGVSTATVSNVIHGKTKKISVQTVRRVQEKLEERGYIPNMAATLLAQNSSRIIGVVINNHEKYEGRVLTDPFIVSSINDLADEIERNDYFMMIKKTTDLMTAVKLDDRSGGRQVGEYLRGLGHRRVLCVSDNQECMDQQRYEGLCDGLGFQADFMIIPMQKEDRDRFYQDHFAQLRSHSPCPAPWRVMLSVSGPDRRALHQG